MLVVLLASSCSTTSDGQSGGTDEACSVTERRIIAHDDTARDSGFTHSPEEEYRRVLGSREGALVGNHEGARVRLELKSRTSDTYAVRQEAHGDSTLEVTCPAYYALPIALSLSLDGTVLGTLDDELRVDATRAIRSVYSLTVKPDALNTIHASLRPSFDVTVYSRISLTIELTAETTQPSSLQGVLTWVGERAEADKGQNPQASEDLGSFVLSL